jgi:hypothetical protein
MVPPLLSAARRGTVIVLDVAVVLWIAAWIVVAVLIGREVHRLRSMSDTLTSASEALHQTADGLQIVSNVPLVGHRIGELAGSIDTTATQVAGNAQDTRHSVDRLAYLFPIGIALIPTVPVAAFYLPPRLRRVRERRALREALRRDGRERVERYLAHRAVDELSYRELRRVTDDPWRDLLAGRYGGLAAAQFERLGIGPGRKGA